MQIQIGIQENQVINSSKQMQEKAGESGGGHKAAQRKNTIFAGDLPLNKDPIALRRQQAQKRAMKFVQDAWAGDRKLDQSQEEIREQIRIQLEEAGRNDEVVRKNEDRMEKLRQEYGVAADSEEQKDLERLEEMYFPNMRDYAGFTEEEQQKTESLMGKPLTEYQQKAIEVYAEKYIYQDRVDKAEDYARYLQSSLTDMKIERLKYHKMEDAQKNAEKVMEQASEEIQGMLVEEAKDHVDETYEEQREEAEKKAEEKEAQEEKIELRREQRELMEARIEEAQQENRETEEAGKERERDAREEASFLKDMADAGLNVAGAGDAVKAEIKDMLNKMKLIEADIKGIEVDEEV